MRFTLSLFFPDPRLPATPRAPGAPRRLAVLARTCFVLALPLAGGCAGTAGSVWGSGPETPTFERSVNPGYAASQETGVASQAGGYGGVSSIGGGLPVDVETSTAAARR